MISVERKHRLTTRWTHRVNFPVLSVMVWSGFLIYWANGVYRVGSGSMTLFHFFPEGFYKVFHIDHRDGRWKSADRSLEATLTVHRLRVPHQLRRTLCCTNVIESAFSIVETVCRNVKRWQGGDQIERWVGSGLLVAEQQFRKVIGFRHIPFLLSSMANAVSSQPIAKKVAIA